MKKFWKGVLAFGPLGMILINICGILLVYIMLFVFTMYSTMSGMNPMELSSSLSGIFMIIIFFGWYVSFFVSILFCFLDMIIFCIYACTNPKLDQGMKVLWCFLFVFFQFIVYPIYWGIYIYK